MNDESLGRVLSRCLDRIAAGETAAACLAAYPEHAAELAPLLTAAAEMSALRSYTISNAGRQRMRAQILNAEIIRNQQRAASWWRWPAVALGMPRLATGFIVALLCVVVTTAAVAASQPGDLAYGVRVAVERAPALLTRDPQGRARAELGIVERRLGDLDRTASAAGSRRASGRRTAEWRRRPDRAGRWPARCRPRRGRGPAASAGPASRAARGHCRVRWQPGSPASRGVPGAACRRADLDAHAAARRAAGSGADGNSHAWSSRDPNAYPHEAGPSWADPRAGCKPHAVADQHACSSWSRLECDAKGPGCKRYAARTGCERHASKSRRERDAARSGSQRNPTGTGTEQYSARAWPECNATGTRSKWHAPGTCSERHPTGAGRECNATGARTRLDVARTRTRLNATGVRTGLDTARARARPKPRRLSPLTGDATPYAQAQCSVRME